jgi:hypothetical protein
MVVAVEVANDDDWRWPTTVLEANNGGRRGMAVEVTNDVGRRRWRWCSWPTIVARGGGGSRGGQQRWSKLVEVVLVANNNGWRWWR